MTSHHSLQISGLTKRYGDFVALAPTDLDVRKGEFLTLLGPSGSGKTTLLSLIAGLVSPDGGAMHIDGVDATHNPPYERDIGLMFQNYALFPHMTVAENIAFPLKMRKTGAANIRERVAQALDMVRLPQVAQRYPRELSGGQQQRIALARCMVYQPAIILMDEPLGALDKKLRDQMQLEIKRIHRELQATIVYVTHDQEEAMTMSDRICLMNGGRIEQLGTPTDLYFRPDTLFAADFLGESNLLGGIVVQSNGGAVTVRLDSGETVGAAGSGQSVAPGAQVRVMIRPQNVHLGTGSGGTLQGQVLDRIVTGSLTKLYVQCAHEQPMVLAYPTVQQSQAVAPGQALTLGWDAGEALAIPEQAS